MDIRKLEAFCRVYESQSFSKAGDAMFLSQPTISSHVANLEEELGVKLFDRLGRKVIPTQAGEVLYRDAADVFVTLDRAKASIELLRDKVVGELVIGCSTIPSQNILPGMVARFSRKYPEVNYTIHVADSAEVVRRVSVGDWPLGIIGQKPSDNELCAVKLLEDVTCVVAAADAPWLPDDKGGISVRTLARLPWIMRELGSATRQALEDGLIGSGIPLQDINIRCQVQGTCEALSHVLAGVGISVTSELACKEYLDRGSLVRLSVPELEGTRQFYLIYHRARQMFPALQAFIDFV